MEADLEGESIEGAKRCRVCGNAVRDDDPDE